MFASIKKSGPHEAFVHGLLGGDLELVRISTQTILHDEISMVQMVVDVPPDRDTIRASDCKTYVEVTYGLTLPKAELKKYKAQVSRHEMIESLTSFGDFATKGVEFQAATAAQALHYLYELLGFLKAEISFFAEHMWTHANVALTQAMGNDMPVIMNYLSTCLLRSQGGGVGMMLDLDDVPPDIIFARMAETFGITIEKFSEHVPDDLQLASYERAVAS